MDVTNANVYKKKRKSKSPKKLSIQKYQADDCLSVGTVEQQISHLWNAMKNAKLNLSTIDEMKKKVFTFTNQQINEKAETKQFFFIYI